MNTSSSGQIHQRSFSQTHIIGNNGIMKLAFEKNPKSNINWLSVILLLWLAKRYSVTLFTKIIIKTQIPKISSNGIKMLQ